MGTEEMTELSDPNDKRGWWETERSARGFYVTRELHGHKEYHRSEACNYGPRGRIISYRTEQAAQHKVDELNDRFIDQTVDAMSESRP